MLLHSTYLTPHYVYLNSVEDRNTLNKQWGAFVHIKNIFVKKPRISLLLSSRRATTTGFCQFGLHVPTHAWESVWHVKGTGQSPLFLFSLFCLLPSPEGFRAHFTQGHRSLLSWEDSVLFLWQGRILIRYPHAIERPGCWSVTLLKKIELGVGSAHL